MFGLLLGSIQYWERSLALNDGCLLSATSVHFFRLLFRKIIKFQFENR